jgi:phosphate transport system substrate-binding protein
MNKMIAALMLLILVAGIAGAQEPEFRETLHAKADPRIPAYKPVKGLSGEVQSFGTETMEPLMKLWIDAFTKLYPAVTIQMRPWRERKGAAALAEGLTQFIPVSRELLPAEVYQFTKNFEYDPLAIRVALGSYRTPAKTGALTFVVHPSNPIAKLNLAQLEAIYCTSRNRGYKEDITTWGQLGLTGEWANREIQLVGVIQPDGLPNHIQLTVCRGGEFKKGIREENIGRPVSALERIVADVSKEPAAIGYASFYYLKPGVKALAIAETEKDPYLKGSFEEVASAQYPLTRFIHIYVNKMPGKPLDPKVNEFLRYILSREGQKDVEQEGIFMPLPARIVKQELEKLK